MEDSRPGEALPVLLQNFADLWEDALGGLAHLATSPILHMARSHIAVAWKGLGTMGSYVIPQDLWQDLVPESFLGDALSYDVEADPEGGCGTVGVGVAQMASPLQMFWVISTSALPSSCFAFIIFKSSKKVSLILSRLGMNERIGEPPPSRRRPRQCHYQRGLLCHAAPRRFRAGGICCFGASRGPAASAQRLLSLCSCRGSGHIIVEASVALQSLLPLPHRGRGLFRSVMAGACSASGHGPLSCLSECSSHLIRAGASFAI